TLGNLGAPKCSVFRIWELIQGAMAAREKCHPKRILICERIDSDTLWSETSQQLSMPVWERNTESLNQAGVRKNRISWARRERPKFLCGDGVNTPRNQPASLSSRDEPVQTV